jgi:hypothetical protein
VAHLRLVSDYVDKLQFTKDGRHAICHAGGVAGDRVTLIELPSGRVAKANTSTRELGNLEILSAAVLSPEAQKARDILAEVLKEEGLALPQNDP